MKQTGAPAVDVRALLRLAWPAAISYILGNAYRINDQFWIQGLGGAAQSAIGATMFVLIMNFALVFLCVGGTLALVARATGAGDRKQRDRVLRTGLLMGLGLGIVLTGIGSLLVPYLSGWIGLTDIAAVHAEDYLGTLFLGMLVMVAVPLLDNALIGMGNTLVPLVMQVVSLSSNFILNPLLIYGTLAPDRLGHVSARPVVWVAELSSRLAEALQLDTGFGMQGAALATLLSRTAASAIGLGVLIFHYRVKLRGRVEWKIARDIVRIGAPVTGSIALYAGVYWVLLNKILAPLGESEIGGLGIGFQVFEGVAFPCFLGVAQACASLVGRSLGAQNPAGAKRAVASGYRLASVLGTAMALAFYFGGPHLIPYFTTDPEIAQAALVYVRTLAFSQIFVVFEAVNEKALLGAGVTRPAVAISITGNLLRLPLAWLFALQLGWGGLGVWWAINLTSVGKALALGALVRRGHWLHARPDSSNSD